MKRVLLIAMGLFLLSLPAAAQVLEDFETGMGDVKSLWGSLAGLTQIADPSGTTAGVLEVNYNASGGAFGLETTVDAATSYALVFWVWLPATVPDDMAFKVFAQDNANWAWNQYYYTAVDIPKEVWYPLIFDMEAIRAKPGSNFDHHVNKLGKLGIEITTTTWTGQIYVDNIGRLNANPNLLSDFEASIGDVKSLWGGLAGLTQIADPSGKTAGVLEVNYNASGGAFGLEKTVDASTDHGLVFWVWLPATVPDDMAFKVFAQDNANWAWNQYYYTAVDIPKEVWYPLIFDMEAIRAKPGSLFDHHANKLGKLGVEITTTTWTGQIYVDNIGFVTSAVGKKWNIADFNAAAGGAYGFTVEGWGPAFGTLTNVIDPTNPANRVLAVPAGFGTNDKGNMAKQNVTLYSADADTFANEITIDLWIPADLPEEPQISLQYTGTTSTWSEQIAPWHGGPDSLVKGEWNTIHYDALAKYLAGEIDPTKPGVVRLQIYYPAPVPTYAGEFYVDNVTLWGIQQPQGSLTSPTVAARPDTSEVPFKEWYFTRIEWADNTLGSESYNVYRSAAPITDLAAPEVVQIATNIPHGIQLWGDRPWSTDGATTTHYFAVTATDGITETPLSDAAKAGPFTFPSSATAKAQYVADFASTFVIDGQGDEFTPYASFMLIPEGASDSAGLSWTPASTDINYKITFIIDETYLYIFADVTDDDIRMDAAGQSWEGDAIEFYMGFYDVRPLTKLHPQGVQKALGDWRVGFNAQGFISLDGGAASTAVPGVTGSDYGILAKLTGDGYTVEAKLNLDSLAQGQSFTLTDGMLLPLKIDLNDWDPLKGDTARRQIAQFGGTGVSLDQSWTRPSTWGYLEVVGGPTSVAEENTLPTEYKLYTNFPNPFNPSTIIRYDLKEDVDVMVKVYSVLGQEVATLVHEPQKAGRYAVTFDASRFATGMYVYTIRAGSFAATQKMMFLK